MKELSKFVTKISRKEKLVSIMKGKRLDNCPTNERLGFRKAML